MEIKDKHNSEILKDQEKIYKVLNFNITSKDIIPKFIESPSKEWILYGADNNFPSKLMEIADGSALHGAIIKSLSQQIAGQKIKIKDDKEDLKLQAFIDSCNSKGHSLYDVISKTIKDYILIGAFSNSIVWKKHIEELEIFHTDVSTIRSGKPNGATGEVDKYYFSNNWKKNTSATSVIEYPTFNVESKTGTQIFYYKPYSTGAVVYGKPMYIGMLQWALLESKVGKWHTNSVDNGYTPSILISLNNGIPSPEKMDEVMNDLDEQFKGEDGASNRIVFFGNGKETSPDVTVLNNNDNDKRFIEILKVIWSQILSGWRIVSPELVGIKVQGELSSTDLVQAQELFYATVINPIKVEVENQYNRILKIAGFQNEIEIVNVQPISFTLSDDLKKATLTINEIRKLGGYEELENGNKLIETKPINTLPNNTTTT